jgi:hypothetical protein
MATLVQFQLRAQLSGYIQKAAGQTACARDAAAALVPTPLDMVDRFKSMVNELQRMQQELSDYNQRNQ